MSRRVRAGKDARGDVTPPALGDPDDPASWEAEAAAHSRIVRQLRAVGDGLAWRVLRYNRRIVAALADNDSPGPLVKRADAEPDHERGLAAEIDAVNHLWTSEGRVAILNSLTNCLRIGDVTVVSEDGEPTLHEIKSNPRYHTTAQRRRMDQARDSITIGTPLPRSAMKVVDLVERYVSDLPNLVELAGLARDRGCQGARLPEGRAILVTSIVDLATKTGESLEAAASIVDTQRSKAIRRAGIDRAIHTLRGYSADQAARVPQVPPWTVYPFSPDICALIVCDLLVIETVLSVDALTSIAEQEGVCLEHRLQLGHHQLDPARPAFSLMRRNHAMNIFPNSLAPLLFEMVRPTSWIRGMRELLDQPHPHPLPWTRFADDEELWRPPA